MKDHVVTTVYLLYETFRAHHLCLGFWIHRERVEEQKGIKEKNCTPNSFFLSDRLHLHATCHMTENPLKIFAHITYRQ
jgi:hypothetical protein